LIPGPPLRVRIYYEPTHYNRGLVSIFILENNEAENMVAEYLDLRCTLNKFRTFYKKFFNESESDYSDDNPMYPYEEESDSDYDPMNGGSKKQKKKFI